MFSYFQIIYKFKSDFNIPTQSYLNCLVHYPVFKILWLADYGSSLKKYFASFLTRFFKFYSINISVQYNDSYLKLPVQFKLDTLASFKEIFFGDEYAVNHKIDNAQTIVDLGANTGMAMAYFLTKFNPKSVLCVEGNPTLIPSLKALQSQVKNQCQFYIENTCVTGSHNGHVNFKVSENHRDSQVVFSDVPGLDSHPAASLRSLLDKYDLHSVGLLKMDIEGGEYDILEKDGEIFKRFNNILVEIHGSDSKRKLFRDQLVKAGFELLEIKHTPQGHNCETTHFRRKTSN